MVLSSEPDPLSLDVAGPQVVETNRYGRAVKRVMPKPEGATSQGGEANARKSLGKRKRKSEVGPIADTHSGLQACMPVMSWRVH